MMQTAASMMSASISNLPTSHHCTLKVTGELNTIISNTTRFIASKSKKLNNSLFTVPAVVAAPASTSTSSHQFASSSYGRKLSARAAASPAMVSKKMPGVGASSNGKELADRVVQIHSVEEFDAALESAESRLVVVEYAGMHSENSKKIYPAMVDLSQTCKDTVFLLVLGDETEGTKELCVRAGIEKVPHFTFYKNKEVIHEEEGIDAEQLQGDVLYYGDPDAPIHQLHGRADFEALLQEHKADDKLVIVDVGLKNCGPCVKVYPTFIKLSKRMAEVAVFARLHGDESDDCMELLKAMGVVEVPTFLFIKDGKLCGRYVGSGKGELIGEILRHSGVRVTY